MEIKVTPGKRRWWISSSQMETDTMALAHCRSENPVGGPAVSHRFRKYTENIAPPTLHERRGDVVTLATFRYLVLYRYRLLSLPDCRGDCSYGSDCGPDNDEYRDGHACLLQHHRQLALSVLRAVHLAVLLAGCVPEQVVVAIVALPPLTAFQSPSES